VQRQLGRQTKTKYQDDSPVRFASSIGYAMYRSRAHHALTVFTMRLAT
jgi:hypothetical protein